jgi:hypothetical protein
MAELLDDKRYWAAPKGSDEFWQVAEKPLWAADRRRCALITSFI